MKLKEIILNDFLTSDHNFTIYQTDFEELEKLYDLVVKAIKDKVVWRKFLLDQKAIAMDGKIEKVRFDREVTYVGKNGSDVKAKVTFKFPVLNFIRGKYNHAINSLNNYGRDMEYDNK